jgi:hypothetical protein
MKTLACSFISVIVTGGASLVLANWSRYKKRGWDEYYPLLREFDWEEARYVFDHEQESRAKRGETPEKYRRDQRARLDLGIEMVCRAYHNNRLSYEFVHTDWRGMNDYHLEYKPDVVEAMKTALNETKRFKWMARYALIYMWLLSMLHFDEWRFMPVPSVVARRKVFDNDLLQAYDRMKQAIAHFVMLGYNEEAAELVLAKM